MKFTADFETTTQADDCHVWASARCNIETLETDIFESMDEFMESLNAGDTYYFHNLKFDGDFIVNWLFRHGYEWVDSRTLDEHQFTTLIDVGNRWYNMSVNMGKGTIKIIDSLKILPFSVKNIAEDWGFEEKKGSIDYNKPRPLGYKITDEERDYVTNDVVIVAKALKVLFDEHLIKSTQAANAMYDFKKMMGGGRRFQEEISYA